MKISHQISSGLALALGIIAPIAFIPNMAQAAPVQSATITRIDKAVIVSPELKSKVDGLRGGNPRAAEERFKLDFSLSGKDKQNSRTNPVNRPSAVGTLQSLQGIR